MATSIIILAIDYCILATIDIDLVCYTLEDRLNTFISILSIKFIESGKFLGGVPRAEFRPALPNGFAYSLDCDLIKTSQLTLPHSFVQFPLGRPSWALTLVKL